MSAKIILIVFFILITTSGIAYSQDIKREGNVFKTTTVTKSTTESVKTKFIWEDSKGVQYPIYVGKTGSCYILRVSKNTGKEYKYYLGEELSKQVCKEIGIEYKSKE